ncbi:hypothetical protein AVEN_18325-1 [Araneus ventricosus]|uniref:Uncharacterized protein n=1 Tax=Araneus ventricosus TaxID=182803 RepID=A0A4Y2ERK1_ARAVE|nr:hypothetical protein AVEN_18325-1 [Araneus ventricosus]
MDSSASFNLFSSLRVVGGLSSLISPLWVHLMTTRPTAFSPPLSQQQPPEIRLTSIEVEWPVTAGLGVRVLNVCGVRRISLQTYSLCKLVSC